MDELQKLYASYRDFDLLVDSRLLNEAERTLFFALPGARTDGHDYITDLLRQGVQHFVVREEYWIKTFEQPDRVEELSLYTQATFIAVDDVLEILHDLVTHHRKQFAGRVIAITGSNGKTIVKDWLTALLNTIHRVHASPRSYNSQIGVPLSVWGIKDHHEIAIIEAGVSKVGEMEKLTRIIQPTHGIFTNLGEAHAAGFGSREEKLAEKLSLFETTEWTLFSRMDELVLAGARDQIPHPETWWLEEDQLKSSVFNESIGISKLPALPEIFHQDALMAIATARAFGVTQAEIDDVLPTFRPLEMRLRVRAGRSGSSIINDSYSNDLTSLAAALDFAQTQAPSERLTVILSDLAETGVEPETTYTRVAQLLSGKTWRVIGVGPEIKLLGGFLAQETIEFYYYQSSNALADDLDQFSFRDETILLKGARSFALEKLVDKLTSRRHRTLLEIDLDAINHNLTVYRNQLPAETGLAVMVKASAYGSGSIQVARLLAGAGVSYLIVAYTDEGIALREAGIETPIMVLNPEEGEYPLLTEHQLEAVITNLGALEKILANHPGLPLHLEFDTGMGRLGFNQSEIDGIIRLLKAAGQSPRSIFTHLAASDDSAHDEFTRLQLNRFSIIDSQLRRNELEAPLRHVLNTNGISRFPEAAYEMVRLGIGLYGLGDREKIMKLRPALRLKAAISGLRKIEKGDVTVGYGRKGTVRTGSTIATVSIGYADGLPRLAGEGRYGLLVKGQVAPIVGAVCMDMCMIDVTNIPEVTIGDEVIVFGPQYPIEALADAANTIPYEILTGVGARVHRLYVRE